VELLHELLPAVSAIALLGNPSNANFQSAVPDVRAAADAIGQRLEVLTAGTESELEAAFVTILQQRVGALVVAADPFLIFRGRRLVELAGRYAIPTVYPSRAFADLGGLMSYRSSVLDLNQQAGIYIGKIPRAPSRSTSPSNRAQKLNW
jgi:putative tryptophan/tyrosine transport system substrate-binding protein